MHYVWKEWKENRKGKGLWLSFAFIVLVSLTLMFRTAGISADQGFYVLLVNLFDMLIYIIPILALFLGAFSIYQEKVQKTLVMILTRKDSFFTFLINKSLAVQSIILIPTIIWFFIYLLPLKFRFIIDWKSYVIFVLVILAITFIFTQIGVLIGCLSQTKMQIVGFAVVIWFYFFFLHDFLLLFFLPNVTYDNVKLFSLVYFLNPLQTGRMYLESALGLYNFDHMSKLLQSFMWLKPYYFLIGNLLLLSLVSFFGALFFHRKEGTE